MSASRLHATVAFIEMKRNKQPSMIDEIRALNKSVYTYTLCMTFLSNKSFILDKFICVVQPSKSVVNNTINIVSKLGTFTKSFSPQSLLEITLHVVEGLVKLATCSVYQVDNWRFGKIPKLSFIWPCCNCTRLDLLVTYLNVTFNCTY